MINILIVDDSGVIRLQIKHMLSGTNCIVFEAAHGKQVLLNMFSKEHSLEDMDLILLDIHLGEIDGYEVLKNITNRYPSLPVIMISTERKKENILKFIQAGAKDYILKPFNKELLISRISRFYKIMTKEQIELDIKELDNVISTEVDRAIRANTAMSVLNLSYKVNKDLVKDDTYRLRKNLIKFLRKIDSVFVWNEHILLILPLTNKDGLSIIKQKISRALIESGIIYEDINEKVFCFPDDLEDKNILERYESNRVGEIILQKIS